MGLSQIAARLIARHGFGAEILRRGPDNQSTTPPTLGEAFEFAVQVAVVSDGGQDRNGIDIQVDRKKVLVSSEGLAIEPEISDRIRINGRLYDIGSVKRITRGAGAIFYELQVVRS